MIVIHDDEFFLDKYPKLPINLHSTNQLNHEMITAIETLSKKINAKQVKGILVKSFNILITNLPLAAEKSLVNDKFRFLAPYYLQ
jgi:hypothetical protein